MRVAFFCTMTLEAGSSAQALTPKKGATSSGRASDEKLQRKATNTSSSTDDLELLKKGEQGLRDGLEEALDAQEPPDQHEPRDPDMTLGPSGIPVHMPSAPVLLGARLPQGGHPIARSAHHDVEMPGSSNDPPLTTDVLPIDRDRNELVTQSSQQPTADHTGVEKPHT